MILRLPPISALRTLEAAARHLSYTRAAQELNITQSAVSHQIRHAEELWGLKLFERRGRRIVITEAGQTLAPIVRDFISRMNDALQDLHVSDNHRAVRVTLLQSLAIKWLVPRLGHFNRDNPDIDVWISASNEVVDLNQDNVDLAIRLGLGNWPGLHSTLLMREYVFPVCSPSLIERLGEPETPRDLLRYPLLRRYLGDICPRWKDWFADAGIQIRAVPKGTRFPDTGMAIQAAIDGQGVGLARSAHVADDLAAGRLVKLFDVYSPSSVAYYIVTNKARVNQPDIVAFREWLLAEATVSQKEFDRVVAASIPNATVSQITAV
ncbi:MAG: transcriptional regulator GcvA [Arenicellales bacterium WSBS_2016_MAG_OTU3]